MKTQTLPAFSILSTAVDKCAARKWHTAGNRIEEITSAPHYCERGYSTEHEVILFGNWNDPCSPNYSTKKYANREQERQSKFFCRTVKALEQCAELEWSDEWTTCSDCGGALRTSGDCYGWQRAYVELECDTLCFKCAQKDAASIVEGYENEDRKCLTADLGFDLVALGYLKLDQTFEHGLYGGQDADPRKIAATLRKLQITRFVFLIDSVGQFDARFSVWVHSDESDKMPAELGHEETACDLDPAEGLKRALQSAPMPTGEGITYTKVDMSTGTATSRKVSPQEFIEGIKD